MEVLAVGATGQYAGLVVPALKQRGITVRALVHDDAKSGQVRENGADHVVVGDLRDRGFINAALRGVDGVFHVTPAFAPDSAELGTAMVKAAVRAGVKRFVFSGVYHPSLSLVNHASMRPVEQALYRSDLRFTILQPAMFMQGLSGAWTSAASGGVVAMPYSADAEMTFVDYRDVAETAAIALAGDELAYGTFELAAGGSVTVRDIATMIGDIAGRTVQAQTIEPDLALADMPAGFMRNGLFAMFADYTAHGFHGGNNLVLRSILGREPRTLRDYFTELNDKTASRSGGKVRL